MLSAAIGLLAAEMRGFRVRLTICDGFLNGWIYRSDDLAGNKEEAGKIVKTSIHPEDVHNSHTFPPCYTR